MLLFVPLVTPGVRQDESAAQPTMLAGGPSCLPAHTTPEQARINLETTIAIDRAVPTGKTVRLPLET
ncbi:MAG: hypothetical protein ACREUP_11630 [Burkholderiales bacterium]